ncbi:MAG: GTPase HflX [Candidatus Rokuibacteriota bacterium]|nr:MAG: GTPase HflX [Candidatus Rokubacteria bacterium]
MRRAANGTRNGRERAMIGALRRPSQRRWQVDESLEELAGLVTAAGGTVVGRITQERAAPAPGLFFGRGKIDEIGATARAVSADLFVSDDPLSPIQERNISEALGIKVIDRTALILDIFAQRARTSEGKLQVELAQLTYLLPRLVGQWTHLERLGGGIGTRGPGETQLESDRRVIRRKVMQIRRQLEGVQVHRRLQRQGRRRAGVPVVALVGYTNAGKTTLLNRLAGSRLTAADQLFVTLDPAARLVHPEGGRRFVLTDTVGFIRKLPHELVAAFRATLEELADADVLLHVVDASHPALEEHMQAVDDLLRELAVADRPTVLVMNKVDRLETGPAVLAARRDAVAISAADGTGLDTLLAAIERALPPVGTLTLRIPHADGAALALCYDRGRVLARRDGADHVEVDVDLPIGLLGAVARYRVAEPLPILGMVD